MIGETIQSDRHPLGRGYEKIEISTSVFRETSEQLKKYIVGQDEAVNAVARAILRSKSGLRDLNKPIASMIFLGQTGVGKTELAKATAKVLFGDKWDDHFKRIDGTSLQEGQDIKKIQGAGPEYVGYGDPLLIPQEFLGKQGGNVILLDEFEKAHPKVWRLFLSILGEGQLMANIPNALYDAKNKNLPEAIPGFLNFRNSFILFTSNIGSEAVVASRSGKLGFETVSGAKKEELKPIILRELKKTFRIMPEFLGRIGESNFVVFNPLSQDDYSRIFDMDIAHINHNQVGIKTPIMVTPKLKEWLIKKAVGKGEYGARDIQDIIKKHVLATAAETRVSSDLEDGSILILDLEFNDGKIAVWRKKKRKTLKKIGGSTTTDMQVLALPSGEKTEVGTVIATSTSQEKTVIRVERNEKFQIRPSFESEKWFQSSKIADELDLNVHAVGNGHIRISEEKPDDVVFASSKARRYSISLELSFVNFKKVPNCVLIFPDGRKYKGVNDVADENGIGKITINKWADLTDGCIYSPIFDQSDFETLLFEIIRTKAKKR